LAAGARRGDDSRPSTVAACGDWAETTQVNRTKGNGYMSYDAKIADTIHLDALSLLERRGPRAEMTRRLPRILQPFLTWLTAKPAPGEAIRERNPLRFVITALAQVVAGVAVTLAAAALPWAAAIPLALLGLIVTS